MFGDSGSVAVVVEIAQNGNMNEHSGTDDKLSAFFLVFFDSYGSRVAHNIADSCESLPDSVLERR